LLRTGVLAAIRDQARFAEPEGLALDAASAGLGGGWVGRKPLLGREIPPRF
jgi:hypothetical protein